jgi:methionine-rich copper-binding protein CopC
MKRRRLSSYLAALSAKLQQYAALVNSPKNTGIDPTEANELLDPALYNAYSVLTANAKYAQGHAILPPLPPGSLPTIPNAPVVTPPDAPVISSFAPASGAAGGNIVIMGTDLANVIAYSIGGVAGLFNGITANTSSSVTLRIPALAKSGKVVITTPGGVSISAGSFTLNVPVYTASYQTTAQDFTAKCGNGSVAGASVTGTASSTVSQAAALAAAKIDALTKIVCPVVVTPTTYTASYQTTAQDFTAKCGSGTSGASVTGTASSTVSQAAADAAAKADALAKITCPVVVTPTNYTASYQTTAQDFTTKCGSGTSGASVTGTASSTVSQAAADAAAKADALSKITCPVVVAPTNYTASYQTTAQDFTAKCGSGTSGASVTGTASSTVSQAAADAAAKADALAKITCPVVVAPTTYTETLTADKPEGSSVSFATSNNHKISFNTIADASGSPFDSIITWNGQTSFATLPAEYLNQPMSFTDAAGVVHTTTAAGAPAKFVDGAIAF